MKQVELSIRLSERAERFLREHLALDGENAADALERLVEALPGVPREKNAPRTSVLMLVPEWFMNLGRTTDKEVAASAFGKVVDAVKQSDIVHIHKVRMALGISPYRAQKKPRALDDSMRMSIWSRVRDKVRTNTDIVHALGFRTTSDVAQWAARMGLRELIERVGHDTTSDR